MNLIPTYIKIPYTEHVLKVMAAIKRVRDAGVRVMMVTGDHPATARAIAVEVGIATSPKCHVVTGDELRSMSPDVLYWTLDKHYEIGNYFYNINYVPCHPCVVFVVIM